MDYDPDTGRLTWKPRPEEMFPEHNRKSVAAAWNAKNAGKEACACIDGGYKQGGLFYNKMKAHRAAWAIMTGQMPAGQIDHINGDGTDNRWENLRLVDTKENARNQKKHVTNTSGYTGVSWNGRKWEAYYWSGTNNKTLGKFDCVHAAGEAARKKREEMGYHANHGTERTHETEK
jgi:hypothetical protein